MENKLQKKSDYESLTTQEKSKINGFTEAEHKDLKAKYGNRLRMVTVETEDGRYDYLVVRPSRAHMMLVATKGKEGDFEAANNVLIQNCVVAGDKKAIDDDYAVYSTLLSAIQEMTEAVQAFIRKA